MRKMQMNLLLDFAFRLDVEGIFTADISDCKIRFTVMTEEALYGNFFTVRKPFGTRARANMNGVLILKEQRLRQILTNGKRSPKVDGAYAKLYREQFRE